MLGQVRALMTWPTMSGQPTRQGRPPAAPATYSCLLPLASPYSSSSSSAQCRLPFCSCHEVQLAHPCGDSGPVWASHFPRIEVVVSVLMLLLLGAVIQQIGAGLFSPSLSLFSHWVSVQFLSCLLCQVTGSSNWSIFYPRRNLSSCIPNTCDLG